MISLSLSLVVPLRARVNLSPSPESSLQYWKPPSIERPHQVAQVRPPSSCTPNPPLALDRKLGFCFRSFLRWWTSRSSDEDQDRKSTRLNSSHGYISYAVFCLKKKK